MKRYRFATAPVAPAPSTASLQLQQQPRLCDSPAPQARGTSWLACSVLLQAALALAGCGDLDTSGEMASGPDVDVFEDEADAETGETDADAVDSETPDANPPDLVDPEDENDTPPPCGECSCDGQQLTICAVDTVNCELACVGASEPASYDGPHCFCQCADGLHPSLACTVPDCERFCRPSFFPLAPSALAATVSPLDAAADARLHCVLAPGVLAPALVLPTREGSLSQPALLMGFGW